MLSRGQSLYNVGYHPQPQPSYVHGTLLNNMLDCKMMTSSMSPTTPLNLHNEFQTHYGGMWEQQPQQQQTQQMGGHKLSEGGVELTMEGGGMPGSRDGGLHHPSERDCHFQTYKSEYLTLLPQINDGYCGPPECHLLEGFQIPPGHSEASFHKLSDGGPSYAESYEPFISDYPSHHHSHPPPPPPHHHPHHPMGCLGGVLSSHGGQCSPGCPCSGGPYVQQLSGGEGSLGGCHPSNSSHPGEYGWDDLPCDPGDYSMFLTKGDSPTTSDSISYTDIDSEMDSKSSGGSHSALTDICHVSPPKRKVGRPPKKDKKLKRNEKKTGRLWEFIRDLLKNPEYCPSLVRWENPEEGHFRFVNSEKVAQLWGDKKGNPRMTYEKLSRAMRYYYKSHVFEPVLGRRLVYKFGYNATNWKPINLNAVNVQKLYGNQ